VIHDKLVKTLFSDNLNAFVIYTLSFPHKGTVKLVTEVDNPSILDGSRYMEKEIRIEELALLMFSQQGIN